MLSIYWFKPWILCPVLEQRVLNRDTGGEWERRPDGPTDRELKLQQTMNSGQITALLTAIALLALNNLFPPFNYTYSNRDSGKTRDIAGGRAWVKAEFDPSHLESLFTGGLWQVPPEATVKASVNRAEAAKWNWVWGLLGLVSLVMLCERPNQGDVRTSGRWGARWQRGVMQGIGTLAYGLLVVSFAAFLITLVVLPHSRWLRQYVY
jgi:hypothetical protein